MTAGTAKIRSNKKSSAGEASFLPFLRMYSEGQLQNSLLRKLKGDSKMEKQIIALADKLKSLRDTKSDVDAESKFLGGEIERLTAELSELMTESEMPSFTHSGYTFSLSTRTFASPLAGDKESLYTALRENGYGDLITESVNSNTLSSTVSGLIEENDDTLPEWLIGKVNTYDKVSVRISKSNKK